MNLEDNTIGFLLYIMIAHSSVLNSNSNITITSQLQNMIQITREEIIP